MYLSSAVYRSLALLPAVLLAVVCRAEAVQGSHAAIAPVPAEVSSSHFIVTVGAKSSPVMLAVSKYYLLNFDIEAPTRIKITADDPHYWDAGVEVQPMRFGIRPHRDGASISFTLQGPAKLSITRPGDHFADSEMLFLFANEPDRSGITSQTPGIRYYAPGVHRENIDAKSGDHIYLAPGAVVFGALNLWQVHDVHVAGRGTIIYDGPQNPGSDEGWMHKPNWHVIVMDNASDIHIEGITGIVRSRTWMIQTRDSTHLFFKNIKIIGGSAGNANQDGIDWLGGGESLIQDSFFRASDDIFAMYGNWDGYTDEAITAPGHEVANITIENSVLSTSISNIVRLGWPRKVFDSHGFTLRDSDVIHMGIGGCGVPFALFEIWADPGGKGSHTGIHLENIRLDESYSLVQLRQPNPSIHDLSFKDIWLMDTPHMVPSVLKGDVSGVSFEGVDSGAAGQLELPLNIEQDAQGPVFRKASIQSAFTYPAGLIEPGKKVAFTAAGTDSKDLHYHWLFGDGTQAEGREVRHAFPDAEGTLLDRSGSFRVLLHVTDDAGHQAWSSQPVVVASQSLPALPEPKIVPVEQPPAQPGGLYERYVQVPVDGGYTLTLLTSTEATLAIDDLPPIHSPKPRPQVCGSPGNSVQPIRQSAALSAGWHRIRVTRDSQVENAASAFGLPVLSWSGPATPR